MFRARWWWWALSIGLVAGSALLAGTPAVAWARATSVDIWTDRGKDAIYEPGEPIEIKVRASDDGYLLVYDIDSEGAVRVLYPYAGSTGYVAGQHTYRVPPAGSGLQLVAQEPVGQGYIVAIVSRRPFNALPRYLRPYDPQAETVGYLGEEEAEGYGDDEEYGDSDVTADGRIYGDPFVAMERIRRRVLYDGGDAEAFGTAYTSYYVHEPVRYPRYLCNDCHQPRHWAWWDGWDPYYASCSAFDFRVYWGWSWGPRYWFGTVPYYCYVPRCYPCAPYDRPYYTSWGGYRQWGDLWGGPLVRYKTPPPAGYVPPSSQLWTRDAGGARPLPPGFMRSERVRGEDGRQFRVAAGAHRPQPVTRRAAPVRGTSDPGTVRTRGESAPRQARVAPRRGTPDPGGQRGYDRPRQARIAPRDGVRRPDGSPRYDRPQPGGRVSAPRVSPGGGTVSPRREAVSGRQGSGPAPARAERSRGESQPAPAGKSDQRPSSSGNRDGSGERPKGH